jgi:hypothetical protein
MVFTTRTQRLKQERIEAGWIDSKPFREEIHIPDAVQIFFGSTIQSGKQNFEMASYEINKDSK